MNRYDKYNWYAPVYSTAQEIGEAFRMFNISDKVILHADFIGAAKNLLDYRLDHTYWNIVRDRGLPHEKIIDREYKKQVCFPCEAELCEPFVITFEDQSTLEIMPQLGGGLKMSINMLNREMEGLNHRNANGSELFSQLIGAKLAKITYQTIEMPKRYKGDTQNKKYVFRLCTYFDSPRGLDEDCGMEIEYRWGGSYHVRMINQDSHGSMAEITYGDLMEALIPVNQILIAEGHDGGSYFWAKPVRQGPKGKDSIVECWDEISIEENDVSDYLYFFLDKYFDEDFPYTCRDDYEHGFEWNLAHNIYTYKTMQAMLEEIRTCAQLLQTDFDHPRLEALKKNCSRDMKEHAELVVDFYERFCRRMKHMMEHNPEYQLISFMGP